ncbi:MAG: winged helix-turn-helix domain-containing protein [Steroidobacteraceae bacterium]|jgi:TolB-like protein/DNA-binding winged helix-turn-helix (wHTH) protein/Tfp pilus assembly protein PilF
MKETERPPIRIGAWRVDAAREQISKDGSTVKLERRSMQLLLCLAEHPGQILSVDELLDRVWAEVVVTPDSVYQAVASLRRVLGDDANEPTYIANIPRRGYSLVAPVAPWVDQPETAAGTPPLPPALKSRTRPRWGAIGAALALVLGLGFLVQHARRPLKAAVEPAPSAPVVQADPFAQRPFPAKSIAVLPFVDLSEDKNQQYFADGMAEEIIARLARVPDLRVPARTSSFYFRDKAATVAQVASALGVANVLEGSVRSSGTRVRVTAQLVRAGDGYQVWSQSYDRELSDIFAVQDDVATDIATALQISLAGGPLSRERGGTRNLDAYRLYLQARSSPTADSTTKTIKSAQRMLRQAIKLDPQFGLAWAQLASMSVPLVNNGDLSPAKGYEEAQRLATHAIEISPGIAEPHALLAFLYRTRDWNWNAARTELRLALNADPADPLSLMLDGMLSMTLGQHEKAEHQLRAAVDRDPLFNYANFNLGNELYLKGKYGEAEATFRRLLDISPRFQWTRPYLAKTLLAQGKTSAALEQLEPGDADAAKLDYLPVVLLANGRAPEAEAALQRLIAQNAATDAYYIAMTYAYRDKKQLALKWLERAYAQRDDGLLEMMGEPLLKNISAEPRFHAILHAMNLSDYVNGPDRTASTSMIGSGSLAHSAN